MLKLDHLALAAATLDDGRARIEETLGVTLQPGGQHAHFGTHNMLLGLEDGLYLEVIAIDPSVPNPDYARWFDLDRFQGSPRLSNWICRTDDLDQFVARFPDAGAPVPLARGDLRWQMAVPGDGILPYDNCFPAIMQWLGDRHPAAMLRPSGCRLDRLVVRHPKADDLQTKLAPVLDDTRIVFEEGPAAIRAEIMTPSGMRALG